MNWSWHAHDILLQIVFLSAGRRLFSGNPNIRPRYRLYISSFTVRDYWYFLFHSITMLLIPQLSKHRLQNVFTFVREFLTSRTRYPAPDCLPAENVFMEFKYMFLISEHIYSCYCCEVCFTAGSCHR